jgi:hypothetical protein
MKLFLLLYALPLHVWSLHIDQHYNSGKPEQGATSHVDNHPTHQPVPQSQEQAHEPDISWMSQDSRNRLQQVRAHERATQRVSREINRTFSPFFLLRDSPSAVVYMTYRDDKFHHCQAEYLKHTFGSMFHTVSVRDLSSMPNFLPAGSIGNELLKFSDEELYKLNDQINKEHGNPSEGAVNIAHALLLPLVFPEIKHLWIIEDDFVFDGASIKNMVNFHSHDDADYMVVSQREYAPRSLWEGWKPLKRLRFNKSTWSGSFAPIMRVSTQFVHAVLGEMLEHDFCFFESFFPTVANAYSLKTNKFNHEFVKNVRWMPEWTDKELNTAIRHDWARGTRTSIYHPFKANQVHMLPLCSA